MSLKVKNPVPTPSEAGTSSRKASVRKNLVLLLKEIPYEKDGELLFTKQQIEDLLNMKYPNGNFFIDMDEVSYEFIGGCAKYRRDGGSIDDLISDTQSSMDEEVSNKKYVYNPIKDKPWFEKERKAHAEEIKRLTTTNTISKGIYKCTRCIKNKEEIVNNTTTEIRQNRAGDEALSIQTTCLACGYIMHG